MKSMKFSKAICSKQSAVVKKYLENGAQVILFGSRKENVEKALQTLKEENPDQRAGVACPASKFAVNGLAISLGRELDPYQIRVNAVAPGVARTDMAASDLASYVTGEILSVDGAAMS